MITALLVDDEPKAIDRLAAMLESFGTFEVIGTARSVGDAERFLRGRTPDVVFLDMNMPGRLGVDLVSSIPPQSRVVFVTAHESHAVEAFRAGAVDYVLKPFDRDRLAITVERLEAQFAVEEARDAGDSPLPHKDQPPRGRKQEPGEASADDGSTVALSAQRGRGVTVVPYADIMWIEAIKNYSHVQARGKKPWLIRRTMAEWEALLPAAQFGRISRSLIVQTVAIRSTQWQSRDQTLVFFNGLETPLPLGRTAAARIKEILRVD